MKYPRRANKQQSSIIPLHAPVRLKHEDNSVVTPRESFLLIVSTREPQASKRAGVDDELLNDLSREEEDGELAADSCLKDGLGRERLLPKSGNALVLGMKEVATSNPRGLRAHGRLSWPRRGAVDAFTRRFYSTST